MKDKLVPHLGLCRKAGKLAVGFDAVRESLGKRQAFLVLLCGDLSEGSARRITALAERQNIEIRTAPIVMDDIERLAGRRAGILAVTDRELAKLVRSAVSLVNEEE